jgi:hypothetical protein
MIALIALLGCNPSDLTTTESVELYVLNSDGSILDGRFSVSNSGLLLGQGHLSLDWIPNTGIHSPYKRSDISPINNRENGLLHMEVGPDSLIQEDGQWSFTVNSGEFDMRLQLTGELEGPTRGDGIWSTSALLVGAQATGSLRSGPSHSIVSGDAVVLRRSGESPPSLSGLGRDSVFVFSSDFSIGIDQVGGEAVAWAFYQGEPLVVEDAVLARQEGSFLLDFRPSSPLYIEVAAGTPHLASEPWQHLTYLERLAGDILFSDHIRRTRGGVARIYFQDSSHSGRAIINVVDTD